jgi:hypothetical protein
VFRNSFLGTMKVVVFHGSLKRFTFISVKNMFLTNLNLNLKLFHFEDFVKELHTLCLCSITFVVLI